LTARSVHNLQEMTVDVLRRTAEGVDELCGHIIGIAINVHRALGPGLLESAYEACVAHDLSLAKIPFERQRPIALNYKGLALEHAYRLDLLVAGLVVVEFKAVEVILPVHEAQVLTYVRLARVPAGLLLNFHVPALKDGVRRYRMLEHL
jgi:GxxExxY protein